MEDFEGDFSDEDGSGGAGGSDEAGSSDEEGSEEGAKPSERRKRGPPAARTAADASGRKRPRRGQQLEIEYEEEREDTRVPRHRR